MIFIFGNRYNITSLQPSCQPSSKENR